jgi:hypothetical protein
MARRLLNRHFGAELEDGNLLQKLKAIARNFAALFGYEVQQVSHGELRDKLQRIVDTYDNDKWMHFVEDVYDDYFVYAARFRGDAPPQEQPEQMVHYYRRDYTIGDDDSITVSDTAVEVVQRKEWVPVQTQQRNRKQDDNSNKPPTQQEGNTMNKEEVVRKLIDNEHTPFDDGDREWLMSMTDEQLAKLCPCANEQQNDNGDGGQGGDPEPKPDPSGGGTAQNAADTSDGDDTAKPVTVDEYIANAPPEVADVLRQAIADHRQKKAQLVQSLLSNKRCRFTQEQLEAKSVSELEQLVELANADVDYTGRAGVTGNVGEKPLEMPKVFDTK